MNHPRFDLVTNRRAIIDRRAMAEVLAAASKEERGAILKSALAAGRSEIERRLAITPGRGRTAAASMAYLADQIVRLAFDSALADSATSAALALVGL